MIDVNKITSNYSFDWQKHLICFGEMWYSLQTEHEYYFIKGKTALI